MTNQLEQKMKLQIMGNGNGSYFMRCHCCFRTSPTVNTPDEIEVYAEAQRQGWTFKRHNGEQWAFCDLPKCQRQAK